MAQHKWLTSDRGVTPLRETRSNSRRAAPHTALLCDGPHVLFNNALLYSGHRFRAPVKLSGVTT
jgi:hypothetical protein